MKKTIRKKKPEAIHLHSRYSHIKTVEYFSAGVMGIESFILRAAIYFTVDWKRENEQRIIETEHFQKKNEQNTHTYSVSELKQYLQINLN